MAVLLFFTLAQCNTTHISVKLHLDYLFTFNRLCHCTTFIKTLRVIRYSYMKYSSLRIEDPMCKHFHIASVF